MKLIRVGDMPFYQGKVSHPDEYGAVRIRHKVMIEGEGPYEIAAVRHDDASGYWITPMRVATTAKEQVLIRYSDAVGVQLNRVNDPIPADTLKQMFGNLWDVVKVCVDEPKPMTTTKPSNPKDAVGITKPSMSVLPTTALLACGVSMKELHPSTVYTFAAGLYEGARKHGRHNYRAIGARASVYYDAAMRHLAAHASGETIDPDSGLPHAAKAVCSLLVLMDAILMNNYTDDRPPPLPSAVLSTSYEGDDNDDWTGLSCLCVRDRLAMWWDGLVELPTIIQALVHIVDGETSKDASWMTEATRKHREIMDRYPEPKEAFTRLSLVTPG